MINKLEKFLLEGKISIIELRKTSIFKGKIKEKLSFCDPKNNPLMTDSYFQDKERTLTDLSETFLDDEELIKKSVPTFAIITRDGKVFRVRNGYEHLNTSLWLLMNGIDLSNSIRLFAWRKEGDSLRVPQFYDGYDLADFKGENPESIEQLRNEWNKYHDGNDGGDHIVEITCQQVIAMQNICSFYGTSFEKIMKTNNSFGLCFRPFEYGNEESAKKAHYNRLIIQQTLGVKMDNFTRILKR